MDGWMDGWIDDLMDKMYSLLSDLDGLKLQSEEGSRMGFTGKTRERDPLFYITDLYY